MQKVIKCAIFYGCPQSNFRLEGLFVLQKNIVEFKYLSQFESIKDFNNNLEAFLSIHKKDFTKSELICFKTLYCFAAKVYGVSNVSIKTLLKAIGERYSGFNVSESTFHRMRRKAVKLGVLSVKTTTRKNGSQSSNIWVFNQFLNTIDTPIQQENLSNQQSSKSGLTPPQTSKNIKTSNILNKRNQRLDYTYTSKLVPDSFTRLVGYFFDDFQVVEKYWSRAQIAVRKYGFNDVDLINNIAQEAFKATIRAIKVKRVRDMYGYFYRVAESKFKAKYTGDLFLEVFESA